MFACVGQGLSSLENLMSATIKQCESVTRIKKLYISQNTLHAKAQPKMSQLPPILFRWMSSPSIYIYMDQSFKELTEIPDQRYKDQDLTQEKCHEIIANKLCENKTCETFAGKSSPAVGEGGDHISAGGGPHETPSFNSCILYTNSHNTVNSLNSCLHFMHHGLTFEHYHGESGCRSHIISSLRLDHRFNIDFVRQQRVGV